MSKLPRFIITLCSLLIIISSCDNKRSSVEQVFDTFSGREIILPSASPYEIQGKPIKLWDTDFTIVNYLDSGECTICRLKLGSWCSFMSQIADPSRVRLITIINSRDTTLIRHNLRLEDFNFPVYIDSTNEFKRLNKIPENNMFHTFLLDSENNIIAMGNPTYNVNIWKSYINFLNEDSDDEPQIEDSILIAPRRWNFGVIGPNSIKPFSFKFYNNSNDAIRITKILPSCECITITSNPTEIEPREQFIIYGTIRPDSDNGYFEKDVDVFIDSYSYPLTFHMSGRTQ